MNEGVFQDTALDLFHFHPACTGRCGFVIATNDKRYPHKPPAAESLLVFYDPLEAAINTVADKTPSLSAAWHAHICGHAAMMGTGLNWWGSFNPLSQKQKKTGSQATAALSLILQAHFPNVEKRRGAGYHWGSAGDSSKLHSLLHRTRSLWA